MNRIIHFIQYHNAFSVIFTIVFVGFGAAFAASPDLRDSVMSSQDIVRSIDNSGIVAADLDNYNFNLQIKGVAEDAENYYLAYAYDTYAIRDYVWQPIQKEKTLDVSKTALAGKDLGIYVAEQLGEVIDYELSYLKEVQSLEKEKGLTQKVVATEYAGLIGQLLDTKEKVFPEYEPVVQPEVIVSAESAAQTPAETSVSSSTEPSGRDLIRQIVREVLEEQQGEATTTEEQSVIIEETSTSTEPEIIEEETQETEGEPVQENPVLEEEPLKEEIVQIEEPSSDSTSSQE